MEKTITNPMRSAHEAERCAARCKRTLQPCRGPAVVGWRVCRMHGAGGGAPPGERHGMYKHGQRSKTAIEERRAIRKLIREAQASIARLPR
jgi:hypothetical protein